MLISHWLSSMAGMGKFKGAEGAKPLALEQDCPSLFGQILASVPANQLRRAKWRGRVPSKLEDVLASASSMSVMF